MQCSREPSIARRTGSAGALAQIKLRQFQIARLCDLQINLRARYDRHRLAGALHKRRLVGPHKAVRRGFGEGVSQQPVAKTLRRLRQHHELAWNGRGDQRAMGCSLHLLDGVHRRQPHNGRSMLHNCVNGAVDGGCIDQRTHRVMHQHDVVRSGGQGGQRMGHRLLPVLSTLHHTHPVGKAILGDLGLDAFYFALAHGYIDRGDPLYGRKRAQRMNKDRNPVERKKLFRLRPGHTCSQARSGKNRKYLHNWWSIQRRGLCAVVSGFWIRRAWPKRRIITLMRALLSIDTTLLKPGLRLAVGLSGGADSVALTRALAERSRELGLVLHAAHLHHGLRGTEADADLAFARALAEELGLPFHEARVDIAAEAQARPKSGDFDTANDKAAESIEEAARRLRYGWFRELMASGEVEAVATAHTLDDQAETVLAKFLRGAWTEGLSGIHPAVEFPEGRILRPLLGTSRAEIETYLYSLGQGWREDSSNRHLTFTRNRIRHELLPQLEDWNPRLREHLMHMAELARDEESWWQAELARLAPSLLLPGRPVRGGGRASGDGLALDVTRLAALAPALQRRLLRYAAEQLGAAPDFSSTEALRALALTGRAGQKCELAQGLRAERTPRELRLERMPLSASAESATEAVSDYVVAIPGETTAPAFGLRLRIKANAASPARESAHSSAPRTALLRNWKPGDRVRLRYSGSPRKVKEVLERLKVTGTDRALWPVLELEGRIIWMRGAELEPEPGLTVEPFFMNDSLDSSPDGAPRAPFRQAIRKLEQEKK